MSTNPRSRPHVFLSYAGPDRERAEGLKRVLELGGAAVFMDFRSIPPGVAWEPVLSEALRTCDTLCVLWTREASKSEWVRREYTTFMRLYNERPCVPLCADDTPLVAPLATRQAPPEFLALANELLAMNRRLIHQGVSRGERARVTRQTLEKRGVTLDERHTRQVLGFAGAGVGGFSLAHIPQWFSQPWAAPTIMGVAAAGAIFTLAVTLIPDDEEKPERPRPTQVPVAVMKKVSGGGPPPPTRDDDDPGEPERTGDRPAGASGGGVKARPPEPPLPEPPKPDQPPPPAGELVCFDRAPPGALGLPLEHNGVTEGDAFCSYLEEALTESQRYFAGLTTGSATIERQGETIQAQFPICDTYEPRVSFFSKLRPSSRFECIVERYSSNSMFQICALPVVPDATALAAFDWLTHEVAQCLRTEQGWTTNLTDRPSFDPWGNLVFYTGRGGIARIYFSRKMAKRTWSVSIVLGPLETISAEEARGGQRATQAMLGLHVALSSRE